MALGRPSKYDTVVNKTILELIKYWVMTGTTEQEIADKLMIHVDTLIEWKKDPKKKDFSEALKAPRDIADGMVEGSLFKKALAGDVTACIFWLKNRNPKRWRDRHEEERKTEKLIIVKADLNEAESK